MKCEVLTASEFVERRSDAAYVAAHLAHPGSEFQARTQRWLYGNSRPSDDDGHISIVTDRGRLVGWARTEVWFEQPETEPYPPVAWDTLEAYVLPEYRMRGIASLAATGLYAYVLVNNGGSVAVFSPLMLLLSHRVGLHPVLFQQSEGEWRRWV